MNENLYLIYVERLYKEDKTYVYKFYFSKSTDFYLNGFDEMPASIAGIEMDSSYADEIRELKTEIKIITIQENTSFSFYDCQDGVVALCYESTLESEFYPKNRLILFYGMNKETVLKILNDKGLSFSILNN